MSLAWKQQREVRLPVLLPVMLWVALRLGRRTSRACLAVAVTIWLLTRSRARRASIDFLRRAADPDAGLRAAWWHFFNFATVTLDRVYLLTGRDYFDMRLFNDEAVRNAGAYEGRGALMFTSHLGSFDVLRALGAHYRNMRFRVVMDRAHGAGLGKVFDRLNPALAAELIDRQAAGPGLMLQLHEALSSGHVVALMADRVYEGDSGVRVRFLDGYATLPLGPWRAALALGVPALLCFGIFRGGRRYELHFEALPVPSGIRRGERDQAAAALAQAYAERLEFWARAYPRNWFNFYDFIHA